MAWEKRRQGRPKRGQNEVGSHFILRQARESMRLRPFDIQSRKDLSTAVGVTPALISYYFPKEVNLADLVLSPIIFSHLQSLTRIIKSDLDPKEKLERLTSVLIDVFRRDGNIFDAYATVAHNGRIPGENLIHQMQSIIAELVKECYSVGIPSPYPLSVQHGAIWGMCRAAADLDRGRADKSVGVTILHNRDEMTIVTAGGMASEQELASPNVLHFEGQMTHLASAST